MVVCMDPMGKASCSFFSVFCFEALFPTASTVRVPYQEEPVVHLGFRV